MEIDPQLPQPGDLVAEKFRIERILGMGGMGIVYAAKHELLHQPIALKLLLPEVAKDKEAVARFLHEGRATARLRSAHVVRVMDVGMVGTAPFLAMELLSGEDLGEMLDKRGRFLITETVDYLLEAMEGLSHAHAAGIIHRDLKPSNLFLAHGEGDTRAIKVVDFGISKSMGSEAGNITATSAVLGSPAYMAPEQLRSSKHVDSRADVWSLGVIAFELLTAALPFPGETVGQIFANVLEKPPTRPGTLRVEIPGKLEEAILRCLQKSPDARFASLGELANAIARFGTGRCDALVANIEARLSSGVLPPIRSSPSIPDLEPTSAPKPRPSSPKAIAPAPPPPVATPGFEFDDEVLGPSLITVDEARAKPSVPRAAQATVITRRAAQPRSAEFLREWLLPLTLHAALTVATFVALRRYAHVGVLDVFAHLPGTTEGSPSSTSAIVGGVFAALCIGCSIAAVASRSARWGFVLSTLGLFAISLGMFLIMGSASGGVVGVPSGEKMFVGVGAPMIAAGFAFACLGKAREAWSDGARFLPPILAVAAGALLFGALKLVAF